ncbi:hypothetical protein QYF36_017568 [Acer negundo]|nr:hypothetical protein QYF36_017568 [Acer negundo]
MTDSIGRSDDSWRRNTAETVHTSDDRNKKENEKSKGKEKVECMRNSVSCMETDRFSAELMENAKGRDTISNLGNSVCLSKGGVSDFSNHRGLDFVPHLSKDQA